MSKPVPPPRPTNIGAAGEDDGPSDGYNAGAKVSVEELMNKDSEDESLRKYKEQLLGAAAKGQTATDPNDKRRVVITELKIIFEDRPGGDVTYALNTQEDVLAMKKKPFIMKEKCHYQIQITFRVQHEIVSGLKFVNKFYKAGIRVAKEETMLGSYAPNAEPYSVTVPRNDWDEAPAGFFARGGFGAKSLFIDDDNQTHLEYEYSFELKSGWT
mmetsp:Transcript_46573/g.74977  ORF Transcript_46573/g.74977 Transcript_46573/m.74977 type:complete len:213 (+) Transcript_46573:3-641(+)